MVVIWKLSVAYTAAEWRFDMPASPRPPVVFRGATVLTMNDAHHVLAGADVLVAGDRIAAVGPGLDVPRAPPRSTRPAASSCRA